MSKKLLKRLGARVRTLRERRDMTQAELGPTSWVSRLEAGTAGYPTLSKVIEVADAMDVSLSVLFKDVDS